jgi:hypothetical protein
MKSAMAASTFPFLLVTLIPQMLAMKLDLDSPCAQLPEYVVESCAAAEMVYEAFAVCQEFLNHVELGCHREYQIVVTDMPLFSA